MRLYRMARLNSLMTESASGDTTVPPKITPFFRSTMSFTKPSLKFEVLLRAIWLSGMIDFENLRSRLIASSSFRPTEAMAGYVEVIFGITL